MHRFISLMATFSLMFLLAYSQVTAHESKTDTTIIHMTETGFDPSVVEIPVGNSIEFENVSQQDRWPASNIHPTHDVYPEFDPQVPIQPGQIWTFRFDQSGKWNFHDHLLPEFTGTITVTGSSENISTSQPSKSTDQPPLWELLKLQLRKFWYQLFPEELDRALETVNVHGVTQTPHQLRYWLSLAGSERIMTELIADSGGGSRVDCHQEAHQVGRMAFELFGARVFRDSFFECHAGYIHGAMESFLKQNGTSNLGQKVDELCQTLPTEFSRFECLHGVGHGVLAFENYDLPMSIQTCNQLNDGFARNSCYGGLFMENIMVAEGKGASPGHKTEWVNDDPHFPCSAVDQNPGVQYECYMMQTSRMLDLSGHNFDFVITECGKAPESLRSVCFKSMGRDVAGQTLRDPQKIMALCNKIENNSEYYFKCVEGALNVIIDFWGENLAGQATELCRIVPNTDKSNCYTVLASRLTGIFNNPQDLSRICQTFETPYSQLCTIRS